MASPEAPSFRLDGRRALVTGGSRGIGFAAAVALARAGAEVAITARNPDQVAAAVAAMRADGLAASGVALDVTDTAALTAFAGRVAPFDILVNSAGGARHAAFVDMSEADFDAVMDVNARATLFVSQVVVRGMIAAGIPGSIIHISSQMGHVGGPRRVGYCASKWAVEGMTKAMAVELGAHRIRVNSICPTFIETEMTSAALADPEFRGWVLSKIKLGRMGRVEDLMGPVLFLASDAAALVTGASLLVDGGWTAE